MIAAMLICGTGFASAQNESWEIVGDPFEVLAFDNVKVPRWIAETVIRAAQKTGVDAAFVMALADKESSFQPSAKARSSSAEGLFQFLESTWLEVLKAHGAKHGFGAAADAITSDRGRYTVEDDEKAWILGLRQDPFISALMACEMVKQSREQLIQKTQRSPTRGELYLAHFLGTNGASRLLKLVAENPNEHATKVFPQAAHANKAIFSSGTTKTGGVPTVSEVHARLTSMIEVRFERYSNASSRTLSPTAMGQKVQLSSATKY